MAAWPGVGLPHGTVLLDHTQAPDGMALSVGLGVAAGKTAERLLELAGQQPEIDIFLPQSFGDKADIQAAIGTADGPWL